MFITYKEMGIKKGDRFINLTTGTIIFVEKIWNDPQVFFIHVNGDNNPAEEFIEDNWWCKVTNRLNPTKTKELSLETLMFILNSFSHNIIPYNGDVLKPVNYLKPYKLKTT